MLLTFLLMIIAQAGKSDDAACGGLGAAGCGCGCVAVLALMVLPMAIGAWKAFTKAGEPGIAALVPIWGWLVLLKISGKEASRIIFWFIPVAGVYFQIVDIIDFAKAYGKEAGFGLGLAFLPMIFWPILGFGSAQYVGAPGGAAGAARRRAVRYEDEEEEESPPRRKRRFEDEE